MERTGLAVIDADEMVFVLPIEQGLESLSRPVQPTQHGLKLLFKEVYPPRTGATGSTVLTGKDEGDLFEVGFVTVWIVHGVRQ